MSLEIWLAYLSAVLILMITPGPSQLLMLSNSLGSGFKKSTATAAGDLTANAIQMTIASVGLASILYLSQYTFIVIKWLGVAYLVYMGVKLILRKQPEKMLDQENQKA
jgi:homoserine/homoserine lactone efflux protein